MTAEQHRFILVHGTFANLESDEGGAWWQTKGPFRQRLNEALAPLGECEGSPLFRWSGENEELDRNAAAKDLLGRLRALDEQGTPYHLVGHSHGGSVIFRALELASPAPLYGLRSWTTLGTPFLHFGLDRGLYWFLVPLPLSVAAMCWLVLPSLMEYWPVLVDVRESLPWHVLFTFWAISAATITAAGVMLAVIGRLIAMHWTLLRRRAASRNAWNAYGNIWIPIWSRADEAINGLRSSVALTIPVTRVTAANDFIWSRIRAFLYGTRGTGTVILRVTNSPISDISCNSLLPEWLDDRLQREADRAFNMQVDKLRPALSQASLEADPSCAFVATLGRDTDPRMLVHCRYTEDADVASIVAAAIRQHAPRSHAASLPARGDVAQSGEPFLSRRSSRFLTTMAGISTFVIAALIVVHRSTWDFVRPFTYSAIFDEAVNHASEAQVFLHHSEEDVEGEWVRALLGHGRIDVAMDATMRIEDPRARAEALFDIVVACRALKQMTQLPIAAKALCNTMFAVSASHRNGQSANWFRLECNVIQVLNADTVTESVLRSDRRLDSLVEMAIHECVSADDKSFERYIELLQVMREHPDYESVAWNRAESSLEAPLTSSNYESVVALAKFALAVENQHSAKVAVDAICRYVDSLPRSRARAYAYDAQDLLVALHDPRSVQYAKLSTSEPPRSDATEAADLIPQSSPPTGTVKGSAISPATDSIEEMLRTLDDLWKADGAEQVSSDGRESEPQQSEQQQIESITESVKELARKMLDENTFRCEKELPARMAEKDFGKALDCIKQMESPFLRFQWLGRLSREVKRSLSSKYENRVEVVQDQLNHRQARRTADDTKAAVLFRNICDETLGRFLAITGGRSVFVDELFSRERAFGEVLPASRRRLFMIAQHLEGSTENTSLRESACDLIALVLKKRAYDEALDKFCQLVAAIRIADESKVTEVRAEAAANSKELRILKKKYENGGLSALILDAQHGEVDARRKTELEATVKNDDAEVARLEVILGRRGFNAATFVALLRQEGGDSSDVTGALRAYSDLSEKVVQLLDGSEEKELTLSLNEESLSLLCEAIADDPACVDRCRQSMSSIADPTFRICGKTALARSAAHARNGNLAAALCGEVLNDSQLGVVYELSNRLKEVATALAESGRHRQSMNLARYLRPQDRIKLMRVIVAVITDAR